MSTSSKSPRMVALAALAVAEERLPAYAHRFAPKTYTQHQLFACLVLKRFHRTDYRGIVAILGDNPTLCQAIGLKQVPHFTTLQKASHRLLTLPQVRKLLERSVDLAMGRRRRVKLAAADSTGLETHHVSRYFVRRRERSQKPLKNTLYQTTSYRRWPKLAMVCDTRSHLILSMAVGRGPSPDVAQLPTLLDALPRCVTVHHLLADAGYDSEANHEYARDYHGIVTTIPPKHGRPTTKPPAGRYRRLMSHHFKQRPYGQRWQAESTFSMAKRNYGAEVNGRSYWSQCREAYLLVLTHNLGILVIIEVFYRAFLTPFSL